MRALELGHGTTAEAELLDGCVGHRQLRGEEGDDMGEEGDDTLGPPVSEIEWRGILVYIKIQNCPYTCT